MTSIRTGRVTEQVGRKNTDYELDDYGPSCSLHQGCHPAHSHGRSLGDID